MSSGTGFHGFSRTSAYLAAFLSFLQLSSQCFTVRTVFAGNEQCLVTYCTLLVLLEDFKFSHTFVVAYPQLGKLWAGCHIFDSVSQFFFGYSNVVSVTSFVFTPAVQKQVTSFFHLAVSDFQWQLEATSWHRTLLQCCNDVVKPQLSYAFIRLEHKPSKLSIMYTQWSLY